MHKEISNIEELPRGGATEAVRWLWELVRRKGWLTPSLSTYEKKFDGILKGYTEFKITMYWPSLMIEVMEFGTVRRQVCVDIDYDFDPDPDHDICLDYPDEMIEIETYLRTVNKI